MKIIDKKVPHRATARDVPRGSVFKDNFGDYCIMTDEVSPDGKYRMIVDLDTGILVSVTMTSEVETVYSEAELTIK